MTNDAEAIRRRGGRRKGSGQASPRQRKFAELILAGEMTQADCYRAAYPASKGWKNEAVHQSASKLMKAAHVAAILAQGRALTIEHIVERRVLDQIALIERWSSQATVDRNELMQVRRVPCRYCHGEGHRYHETPAQRERRRAEYDRVAAEIAAVKRSTGKPPPATLEPFDELGGVGYTIHGDPHPDCPECFGEGEERVFFADTRKLSPEALELYEGVELKRDGMVLRVKDRAAAEDALAKSLGMFVNKNVNLNFNGGGKASADAIPDNPVDAAKAYQQLVRGEG